MSPWFRDRDSLAFIGAGYLPWLASLSLVWEALQAPLYTIWTVAPTGFIVFAIVHCTFGDILIGSAALVLALIVGREGPMPTWRWRRIVVTVLLLGLSYTVFSEWLNTTLSRWTYSELMPTVRAGSVEIGLSPLLQWAALPPLALWLGRRRPLRPTRP